MSKALKSFNQVVIQPGQTISFFNMQVHVEKQKDIYQLGLIRRALDMAEEFVKQVQHCMGQLLERSYNCQRRNHSVPSTYVPIGQDAMVNYGS